MLHLVVVALYLVLVYENENGSGRLLPAVAASKKVKHPVLYSTRVAAVGRYLGFGPCCTILSVVRSL